MRTLRKKLALLSDQQQATAWSVELCAHWMGEDPDKAAVLYVDGHVRVYYGHQTQLPRHYVARQKLCLRATTDYWINAMDGQPFFLVNQAVDPGLLQVLVRWTPSIGQLEGKNKFRTRAVLENLIYKNYSC